MAVFFMRQCICGEKVYSYIKRCPYCLTRLKTDANGSVERSKPELRKELISLRDALIEEDAAVWSRMVADRLFRTARLDGCDTVLCYAAFRKEVATADIIRTLLHQGKTVAVPLIADAQSERSVFSAVRINDFDTDLVPAAYGIPEPLLSPDSDRVIVDPLDLDAVIIPGVGFDKTKNRLGFGKGYFDRYLRLVRPDCVKIALAYSFQVLESIPHTTDDICADMIVTEEYVIE